MVVSSPLGTTENEGAENDRAGWKTQKGGYVKSKENNYSIYANVTKCNVYLGLNNDSMAGITEDLEDGIRIRALYEAFEGKRHPDTITRVATAHICGQTDGTSESSIT